MMHHTSVCTYNNKTSFSSHNSGNQTNDCNQWTGGLNNVSAAEDVYPKPVNKSLTATLPASDGCGQLASPVTLAVRIRGKKQLDGCVWKTVHFSHPPRGCQPLSKLRSGTFAVPVSKLNSQRAVFEKLFTSCRSGTVAVHISKLNNQGCVWKTVPFSHIRDGCCPYL